MQYTYAKTIGNRIFYRSVNPASGERKTEITSKGKFRIFSKETDANNNSGFTNIKQQPLKETLIPSVKEFKDSIKLYTSYGHKLYGCKDPEYQYLFENFDAKTFNNQLVNIAFFDIETARDADYGYSPATEAKNEVLTISLFLNKKLYYWGMKDLPADFIDKNDFIFYWFNQEKDMLSHFVKWITAHEVDILTGWNIDQYDVPYIINRCKNIEVDFTKISPFGKVNDKQFTGKFGHTVNTYEIIGITILDYIDLYKKFTYVEQENYTLDNIAYVELGEKKVDYSETKNLQDLYDTNFLKFTEYSLRDTMLVKRLEDKLKLAELAIMIAYKTGSNFIDTLGTVKLWEIYLYQEMMAKGLVPPIEQEGTVSSSIIGGFVKSPLKGKFKWVVSFDLASLYPHNQMGLNISPEKLLEDNELPEEIKELKESIYAKYKTLERIIIALFNKEIDLSVLKKYNIGMSPNVQFYRNDALGIIPQVLKKVYTERKAVKNEMLQKEQELVDLKEKYVHFETKN